MTTDNDQLEQRIRASLAERAEDVRATPALYAAVQRRTARAGRTRVVAVTASVIAAVALAGVATTWLPDLEPEITDQPPASDATPSEGPTADAGPGPGDGVAAAAGHAFVRGSVLSTPTGTVALGVEVTSVAAEPGWFPGRGRIAFAGEAEGGPVVGVVVDGGDGPAAMFAATPNGGQVVFSPQGDALAWIEGTDLHVLPLPEDLTTLDAAAATRVLPLEGDVPAGLVAEQWFYGADAQVMLASDTAAPGIWSIPLDDAPVDDTGPTDPAFPLAVAAGALDVVLLPDRSVVSLHRADEPDAPWFLRSAVDGVIDDQQLPAQLGRSRPLELTTNGSFDAVVVDPDLEQAVLLTFREAAARDGVLFDLIDTVDGVRAGTPVLPTATGTSSAGELGDPLAAGSGESPIECPTTGVGDLGATSEGRVLTLTSDGSFTSMSGAGATPSWSVVPLDEDTTEAYGRFVASPVEDGGSGLLAMVVTVDGAQHVRVGAVGDTTRTQPFEGVIETVQGPWAVTGDVTGLVWSPTGSDVAWTDAGGLHVVSFAGEASFVISTADLPDVTMPVHGWTWTADDAGRAVTGALALGSVEEGTWTLPVTRTEDGTAVDVDQRGPVQVTDGLRGATPVAADGTSGGVGSGLPVELTRGHELWACMPDGAVAQLPVPSVLTDPSVTGIEMRVRASAVLLRHDGRTWQVPFDGTTRELTWQVDGLDLWFDLEE